MTGRFVCRFAVGADDLVYSGVWRVWTAKNQPDLYLAVEAVSGVVKATVHCPRPPHLDWERHYGFPKEASGEVAAAAKKDGGPHKVRWKGCQIGPSCTLEYRVIFRGISLEKIGKSPPAKTTLLPIPTEQEFVEVAVLLGPAVPTSDYPRDRDVATHLLSEGRLVDGRRVWVVYCTRPIESTNKEDRRITPEKNYVDTSVDFSTIPMRGALFGEQSDGSLAFIDVSVAYVPPSTR